MSSLLSNLQPQLTLTYCVFIRNQSHYGKRLHPPSNPSKSSLVKFFNPPASVFTRSPARAALLSCRSIIFSSMVHGGDLPDGYLFLLLADAVGAVEGLVHYSGV
ncbi:hypothetical protein D770_22890 [Flammeovirgaceae bacterium 311]|nr:hypothetical protein D770_22890 [Flammeovirgaceae bacterium 311]